jgi:hypothetical protein
MWLPLCFVDQPPERGFLAQLTVSKCQLRGQNGHFDALNWHVFPFLYVKKLIKMVKYSYRLSKIRNSSFSLCLRVTEGNLRKPRQPAKPSLNSPVFGTLP